MLFDFSALNGSDCYKLMASTVVPRPIAWVVSRSPEGRLNAAPFSFFNVMSGDPPLLVFGIGGRGPGDAKDTGHNIRCTGEFVVNLVDEASAAAMNVTAIDFPPEVDEIEAAGLSTLPCSRIDVPRIAQSPVAMECAHFMTLEVGPDRSLVLGRVLAMHITDEAVIDPARCYIDAPKLRLIGRMHGTGGYVRTSDRFEMRRIPLAEWTG